MRSTAIIRSSGVRNQAVCGESGKKNLEEGIHTVSGSSSGKKRSIYQKRIETIKVMMPVIIMSLRYAIRPSTSTHYKSSAWY